MVTGSSGGIHCIYVYPFLYLLTTKSNVATPSVKIINHHATLKGNSHQILLSEMSLPGVKVLIEKLLGTFQASNIGG